MTVVPGGREFLAESNRVLQKNSTRFLKKLTLTSVFCCLHHGSPPLKYSPSCRWRLVLLSITKPIALCKCTYKALTSPGIFKTKAIFTRNRELSVGLVVHKGNWKVFSPVTYGKLFWFESLNVEEMGFAAINRKSGSRVLI